MSVKMIRHILSLFLLTALVAQQLPEQPQRCTDGLDTTGDPRNQEVMCLTEVISIYPLLHNEQLNYQLENLGQQIVPYEQL
jgi:hypothetical protein